MARQISLHQAVSAIDNVLAQLDELNQKGTGDPAERQKATSTMKEVREALLGLCQSDDGSEVYYVVNN